MDELLPIILVICIAAASLTIVYVIEQKRHEVPGVVVTRGHTPSSSSWGVDSKGRSVYMTTPESWCLVIKHLDGSVYGIEVTPEEWADHPDGSNWKMEGKVEK
jgi:hypothetical protein